LLQYAYIIANWEFLVKKNPALCRVIKDNTRVLHHARRRFVRGANSLVTYQRIKLR
jgi:hypothetical protein